MTTDTTYVRPEYRRTSAGHEPVDGVQFHSYRVGINRYARISADGQIMTQANHRASTYSAAVIGIGALTNAAGKPIRFRTERAAALAAIRRYRESEIKP